MPKKSVLVIEDEPDILQVMEYNLAREGFAVSTAPDGERGLARARADRPDLILLDLMLPVIEGTEVCRLLRASPQTASIPIIMVTAKGEESDVVLGLGLGADDYVCKPFRPRELIARVRAVLRRRASPAPDETQRITLEGMTIDRARHELRVDGRPVSLTATQMRLLHHLASHPGRVFSRDQLIDHAIGTGVAVSSRNIDVHIRSIRRKLGPYEDRVETVRGVGYRFRDWRETTC
ncbi:MAG: response regulator [Acidobacteriota bacterium]